MFRQVCIKISFPTLASLLEQRPLELAMGRPLPQKIQIFLWEALRDDSPLKHTYPSDVRLWILTALDASPQKLLYIVFMTVLGRKRYGTNPQVSCPCPSSICRYKIG